MWLGSPSYAAVMLLALVELVIIFAVSSTELLPEDSGSVIIASDDTNSLLANRTSYDGFHLLRAIPESVESVDALRLLHHQGEHDFWREPSQVGRPVDILASPDQVATLTSFFEKNGIAFEVKNHNIQSLIDAEELFSSRATKPQTKSMNWDSYQSCETIFAWMDGLKESNPNKENILIEVSSIGTSHQGRDLKMIHLTSKLTTDKKAMVIDGGFHAREFISPATVTFLISQLLTTTEGQELLAQFDWFMLPLVNPDGYVHAMTLQRFWRKNLSDNPSSLCNGVDLNRNFDFHYAEGGSSTNPCMETYHGSNALSEPESKALANFFLSRTGSILAYLTYHSYGQYWLSPWGYTSDVPDDFAEMMRLATIAANAIEGVHGTKYTVGSSTRELGLAAGGSDDYAKGAASVPFSYTVELRDTGMFGFLLPASQIRSNCEESWAGLVAFATAVAPKSGAKLVAPPAKTAKQPQRSPHQH